MRWPMGIGRKGREREGPWWKRGALFVVDYPGNLGDLRMWQGRMWCCVGRSWGGDGRLWMGDWPIADNTALILMVMLVPRFSWDFELSHIQCAMYAGVLK